MNFDHLTIIAREVLCSYTAKMYWVEQYTSLMTLKISLGPRDVFHTFYNPIHPDSGQCMSFLSSLIHPQGYIRKYIPEGQLGLAMLKSTHFPVNEDRLIKYKLPFWNDERMALHYLESRCIGFVIPSDHKISLHSQTFFRALINLGSYMYMWIVKLVISSVHL